VKVVIAFVIAWCLLVVAAIVAASNRRFEGWDIYLVTAAVVVGLAIAIAIALLPSRERGTPPDLQVTGLLGPGCSRGEGDRDRESNALQPAGVPKRKGHSGAWPGGPCGELPEVAPVLFTL
jgi:hypothetical protein